MIVNMYLYYVSSEQGCSLCPQYQFLRLCRAVENDGGPPPAATRPVHMLWLGLARPLPAILARALEEIAVDEDPTSTGTKMADSKDDSIREVIYSAENGETNPGKECWCCARLKLELNSAVIELESATETITMLREALKNAVMEVRNSISTMEDKCSENGLPYSEKTRHQVQRNRHSKRIDKINDRIKVNSVLSTRKESQEKILSQLTEEAANLIPVIVNAEIVTKNYESPIPTIGPEYSKIIKYNNYSRNVNKLKKVEKHNVMIIGDSHCKGISISVSDFLGVNHDYMSLN